jgi:hypothetical protein
MAKAVRGCVWYDRLEWIAADPSIWDRNQYKKDSMTSLAAMLQEEVAPENQLDKMMRAHERSDQRFIQKFSSLAMHKSKMADGTEVADPMILIDEDGCPNFLRECRNLRYQEVSPDKNSSEKLVDKDNHLADCAKYMLLSNPEAQVLTRRPAHGTIARAIETDRIARMRADEFGTDYQEEFSNAY